MSGRLRFTGTRVPIDTLTDCLSAGYTIDEFLGDYPSVTKQQVRETLSLMLSALTEGRRLAHPVVWCVMYETRYGESRRVHQIHATRESAEAACSKLQTGFDHWPGRWEVQDWLVIEDGEA